MSLNANDIIVKAASKNENELADLNVINLEQGKLSTGKSLQPEYSPAYAEYKSSIGSLSSPTPDLKLTGDFHEGIYSKVVSDKIEFGSTDSKEGQLQTAYTENIFGVTDDQLIETIDGSIPEIIDNELKK